MRKMHDMAVLDDVSTAARPASAETGTPTAPNECRTGWRYRWRAGICAALGLLFIVSTYPTVSAHTGATGVVKQRMDLMKALGDAMKRLNAMFANQTAFDAEQVKLAATVIEEHAGDQMTRLFPGAPVKQHSEALPAIWQNWSEFQDWADRLKAYAVALGAAAENERGHMSGHGGMTGQAGMMGQGGMMGQEGMMGGTHGPDPDRLGSMPPDAAFMWVTNTCSGCHTKFRLKK